MGDADTVLAQQVTTDSRRDELLTEFGKATLKDRYLLPGETYQDLFSRVATYYADTPDHAQRLYDYMSKLWFMPATPILSNGGTDRGLPISCFLNEASDSLEGIVDLWVENVWLSSRGGGIGSYWGNLRSIGERIGRVGETSGIIPFVKVQDALTLAISQGSLRRGSAAVYLDVSHPEIEEFLELRRPTGGDPNRKALNLHHGILIPDAFMEAVEANADWDLVSPKDGSVVRTVAARDLWIRILTVRVETGEPYLIFIDRVNEAIPEHHKLAGLNVKMSNLCSEITLPTNAERTAVCCLSSVNIEKYDEWSHDTMFIEDVMRFLDNVLDDFIVKAPDSMSRARYSAIQERSVGLGVMGLHAYFQSKMVPIESVMAGVWNRTIFNHIKREAKRASRKLAQERGPCPDAERYGVMERFSNTTAVAPTASISIICGSTSAGVEPFAANAYTHKTLNGSTAVKNPHLKKLLAEKGRDDADTWSSITTNGGSVQHLDCLTPDEKDVFKTAIEIDQRWLIDLAGDRAQMIDQSQSINLFLPADVHKRDLHMLHFSAWRKGLKSLYYCRSMSIQRAESESSSADFEECLSCQ